VASINGERLDGPVKWSSSNPVVARISGASGEANAALLSPGTTTITAAHGGQSASTTLTVTFAASPVFASQPTDTNVSSVINPGGGVRVTLLDNLGDPLAGQQITLSIGQNPPALAPPSFGSGVLSGSLTQITNSAGTATFADLKIDWLGDGYTLVASANPVSGSVTGTSAAFNELRVGDVCLGPDTPACQGSCADADGDGLNDAWEIAGGVDLNGDGLIDAQHDLLLPGANPAKPDIYVRYDWMDYGTLEYACSNDSDCPQNGSSAFGTATCTGPKIASSSWPASCTQACNTDADCHALAIPGNGGDSHASDLCVSNVCRHTHDPELLTPGAIQAVVDRFAARGFNLHVTRGQPLPHSHVLSLRTLEAMTDACEGGSVPSGTAGVGQYAESFFDLKARSFVPQQAPAYHYAIFGHYNSCDTFEHCLNDGHTGACSPAAPDFGSTGLAEINGNDFIVSLGRLINDLEAFLSPVAPGGKTIGQLFTGGTFMHELGHNLGLRHGGGVSATSDPNTCFPPDCEDAPVFKPNYLSVMAFGYQLNGIQSASDVGQFIPIDTRLDYSTQVLPTVPVSDGVSGVLDELDLDETVPDGLTSGNSDLFTFANGACATHSWPTHSPVDWDGNGVIGDNPAAQADLDPELDFGSGVLCPPPSGDKHRGHIDWGPAPGQSIFRYGFQCTQSFANPSSASGSGFAASNQMTSLAPAGDRRASRELTPYVARNAHVLYPTTAFRIAIRPSCKAATKPLVPGRHGTFSVVLYGAGDLDVAKVDLESLRFHGATPLSTSIADVDGDGHPDLLITFDMAQVKLNSKAISARLTGSMKNSQLFVGEEKIRVVPSLVNEDASCR
jgi:hypothetical protein